MQFLKIILCLAARLVDHFCVDSRLCHFSAVAHVAGDYFMNIMTIIS